MGLNPVPYQAALLAILLVNAYFVYCLARRLGGDELAAWLAALVVAYIVNAQSTTMPFVYDALCCFFYLAAFLYYLQNTRVESRVPKSRYL